MAVKLGTVASIIDPNKFIITFNVPEFIEGMIAYPLDVYDEPRIGDPVWCYPLENKFNLSWVYTKERLLDYTRLKLGNSTVNIRPSSIDIETRSGNTININADGDITISSNNKILINSSSDINVDAKGKFTLKCSTFDASNCSKIKFPNRLPSGSAPGPFTTDPSKSSSEI
jgi:hypothetical protein